MPIKVEDFDNPGRPIDTSASAPSTFESSPQQTAQPVQPSRSGRGPKIFLGLIIAVVIFFFVWMSANHRTQVQVTPPPDNSIQNPPPSPPPDARQSPAFKVKAILFFETGDNFLARENRTYEKRFAAKGTRYVNWELDIDHPLTKELPFEVVWHGPDSLVLTTQSSKLDAFTDSVAAGWGNKSGKYFSVGTYRLDFLVSGEQVASDTFEVYDGDAPPSMFIQGINATVSPLQFFASIEGTPIKENRIYGTRFSGTAIHYMFWEMNLQYPSQDTRREFTIKETWSKPDHTLDHEKEITGRIEAGWSAAYYESGWGNDAGTYWQPGNYQVDLFVDNRRIASGQFEIVD
jgi:hypothetical protein